MYTGPGQSIQEPQASTYTPGGEEGDDTNSDIGDEGEDH